MSVYKKLMDARLELQRTKLNKSGHNKFAGYKYFELGDFLPVIQEIFAKQGLCGVVSFFPDVAVLTITDIDDGSFIHVNSPMSSAALKGCHEVQNLGAVQTYLRRYLWVTAMEIVEHDALDAVTGSDAPSLKPPFKPATKADTPKVETPKVEVPKAKVHVNANDGQWSIKTDDPENNMPAVVLAAETLLAIASSEDDLQEIFQKNRSYLDLLKAKSPEEYTTLMGKFTATKQSLKKG